MFSFIYGLEWGIVTFVSALVKNPSKDDTIFVSM